MSMRWYVVHAYSGFEKSVQRALEDRIRRAGMQAKFGKILVPTEEVVEMKGGQKNISERKFFPGYVLVEMEMDDESWHLVKSTNKVTGFVGGTASKPTPISVKEVANIMHQMQEGVEKPKPKVLFEVGEGVRVKEGPFTDFHGLWKTSTTISRSCACRSRSLVARHRSNWNSDRSRRRNCALAAVRIEVVLSLNRGGRKPASTHKE